MEDYLPKNDTKYNIDYSNILGKGSFGTVYKGTLNKDDKTIPVAMKQISKEISGNNNLLQLLSNEVAISANLYKDEDKNEEGENKMDNIVSFLDIIELNDNNYLVYEFCNGGDLTRYLKYFKTFDEKMIQNILRQILKGLSRLHEKKVVHHDIKPENILH